MQRLEKRGDCVFLMKFKTVGRHGKSFWGFQLHKVIPDIITIGKPIGNGHPLASCGLHRSSANSFANGMEFFNTFGGNPVSCAIANCSLNSKKRKITRKRLEVGDIFKELIKLSKGFSIIGDVRGQGFS